MQPFPGPGPRIPVSTNGGAQPSWAGKSRELFYWERGEGVTRVMAVKVTLGDTFTADVPQRLFEVNTSVYRPGANAIRRYDVAPDGQRFLMFQDKDDAPEPLITHIVVVQNWTEELKRLVPTT